MNKAETKFVPRPDVLRQRKQKRKNDDFLPAEEDSKLDMKIENKWKQFILLLFLAILIVEIGLAIYLSTSWKRKNKVLCLYLTPPPVFKSSEFIWLNKLFDLFFNLVDSDLCPNSRWTKKSNFRTVSQSSRFSGRRKSYEI